MALPRSSFFGFRAMPYEKYPSFSFSCLTFYYRILILARKNFTNEFQTIMEEYFKELIRNVPDFPIEGIVFRDITTLLKDAEGFAKCTEALYEFSKDMDVDKVVGIDSRGFIIGGILANKLNVGFIPIRKPGKLPAETITQSYTLEYGEDMLEIHKDAIQHGDRVLLHDDLLATGGTARAACDLIEKAGGEVVQVSFIIELSFLGGRDKFEGYNVKALVSYDSE